MRFREELRNQILMERLRNKEVDDKIQVGEGEIDNFIADQSGTSPNAAQEVDIAGKRGHAAPDQGSGRIRLTTLPPTDSCCTAE